MKNLLFIFVFSFGVSFTYGQQIPEYTQWMYNQFAMNPAHAGIKKCIDLHSLYRIQWVGLDGAPKSGFFTASIPINTKRKEMLSARHGTGLRFEKDNIGPFSIFRLNIAYSAHFNFNPEDRLSLGVYGGILQMGYDPTGTTTNTPDPSVMLQSSFLAPDASFGAWYNTEDYYAGLVLNNLIPTKWEDIGSNSRNRMHLQLNGAYRIKLNDNFTVVPTTLLRIPPRGPWSIDLILLADYTNFIEIGAGLRNSDALLFLVNLRIKEQFGISYSFDYTISDIQRFSSNTHELSLRFTTCKPENSKKTACPLFE